MSRFVLALAVPLAFLSAPAVAQDEDAKEVKAAVVVLKWSGRDWFVLTSYPEDR